MDSFNTDLDALQAALRALFQTLKRPQQWSEITSRAGVTIDRPAGTIIHMLLASPSSRHRVQDIASALGIEAPSATRKTQELEKAGFLERLPDPDDRRAVSVGLTPAGKRLGKKLQAAQRELLGEVLVHWSASDRQQFIRLLDSFSELMTHKQKGN